MVKDHMTSTVTSSKNMSKRTEKKNYFGLKSYCWLAVIHCVLASHFWCPQLLSHSCETAETYGRPKVTQTLVGHVVKQLNYKINGRPKVLTRGNPLQLCVLAFLCWTSCPLLDVHGPTLLLHWKNSHTVRILFTSLLRLHLQWSF